MQKIFKGVPKNPATAPMTMRTINKNARRGAAGDGLTDYARGFKTGGNDSGVTDKARGIRTGGNEAGVAQKAGKISQGSPTAEPPFGPCKRYPPSGATMPEYRGRPKQAKGGSVY